MNIQPKQKLLNILIRSSTGRAWLRRWGRSAPDAIIVSYPKSGRTWLRAVLGKYYTDVYGLIPSNPGDVLELKALHALDRRIPLMVFSHDDRPQLKAAPDMQTDKSHFALHAVVFLCRDPRDVLISSFFQHSLREKKLKDALTFDGSLSAFVRDPIFGIHAIIHYMNIWAAARNTPRAFLCMRYEDLRSDMATVLAEFFRFIGDRPIRREALKRAVEWGRFENMKKMEKENLLNSPRLRQTHADDESCKVRKGEVGGYRQYLNAEDLAFVDRAVVHDLDPFFGYSS